MSGLTTTGYFAASLVLLAIRHMGRYTAALVRIGFFFFFLISVWDSSAISLTATLQPRPTFPSSWLTGLKAPTN